MSMDMQNNSWPGWETVGLIGRGSFGAVYKIQRNVFGDIEEAALKVISIPQNGSDIDEMFNDGYDEESVTSAFASHLKGIVAEYSMMRKMNGSANIVNCDDIRYVQHEDGIGWDIFIKMELLTPLTKALPVVAPEEAVIQVAKDMCVALALCKKHNIVHRDIKPQNIFLSANGDYKLGDFGISKTVEKTSGGTKVGTYKYMAPEVYHNQPYGTGADIYSLGLVLYWLLNERRSPFLPLPPAKMTTEMDDKARSRRFAGEPLPPPAHGSEKLKQIVLKACAYDPADRYASAEEMLQDLQGEPAAAIVPDEIVQVAPSAIVAADVAPDIIEEPTKDETKEAEPVAEPAEPPVIEVAEENLEPVAPIGVAEEGAHTAVCETEDKVPLAQNSKRGKTGIILAAIGLLAVLAIAIFMISSNNSDSGESTENSGICTTPHKWTAATCTQPETCSVCGITQGTVIAHTWQEANCAKPQTCSVCGETTGDVGSHIWQEATCTQPAMCSFCGTTEGTSLEHQWTDATCARPKTCSVCGETTGDVGAHQWKGNCTRLATCSICGEKSTSKGAHSWIAATCKTPKTCRYCGTTTGGVAANAHVWTNLGNGITGCSRCGKMK